MASHTFQGYTLLFVTCTDNKNKVVNRNVKFQRYDTNFS